MSISEKSKCLIKNATLSESERALQALCEEEVKHEDMLKGIREAKAQVMLRFDELINKKGL